MAKTKLFSLTSLVTTLKGIGSHIVTGASLIPFWLLAMFFFRRDLFALTIFTVIGAGAWYLFFWGWISNRAWHWK